MNMLASKHLYKPHVTDDAFIQLLKFLDCPSSDSDLGAQRPNFLPQSTIIFLDFGALYGRRQACRVDRGIWWS